MKRGTRLAVGFFDGVHIGHRKILSGADAVLTFANHPLSVLDGSHRPVLLMDADERLSMLRTEGTDRPRAVQAVEFTRAFAAQSPESFAAFLRRRYPGLECIRCGGNWRFGANGSGTPATLRALGFRVKVCRYAVYKGERVSSTRIRAALHQGALDDAAAMLGRPYSVSGAIRTGKGIGRSLGAPTLNLAVPELPLGTGVYAVDTSMGPGVANYGVAPTMGARAWPEPMLEVHLFGGAVPAEGALRVGFRTFIRAERSFPSREALAMRIAEDIAEARRTLMKPVP